MDGVFAAADDCLLLWVLAPDAPVDRFDRVLEFADGRLVKTSAPNAVAEGTAEKTDQERE